MGLYCFISCICRGSYFLFISWLLGKNEMAGIWMVYLAWNKLAVIDTGYYYIFQPCVDENQRKVV